MITLSPRLQQGLRQGSNKEFKDLDTQSVCLSISNKNIAETLRTVCETDLVADYKRARAHAKLIGPGGNVSNSIRHRVSLDMTKVDHSVDFINRPYYHQDVAFGTRTLKFDSGESVSMPNVIRTVTRSTLVAQYLKYCKDENFDNPPSRSTLFRILEVREASQRKSMQGLDNTAAEGTTAAFHLYDLSLVYWQTLAAARRGY